MTLRHTFISAALLLAPLLVFFVAALGALGAAGNNCSTSWTYVCASSD